MFKERGIGSQLAAGFGAMVFIIVLLFLSINWQVGKVTSITNRTIDLRAPTVQNSTAMLNAMNLSLAGLRGWMLLGKPKFKRDRMAAWMELEKSLTSMKKLSKNWTVPKNIERLGIIEKKLNNFRVTQQKIEDIAQSPKNRPALHILLTKAVPRAERIVELITRLIDLEKKLKADSQRKALLGVMADFRGAMGMALANIRVYLLSGDNTYQEKFDGFWTKLQSRYVTLSKSKLLSASQREAFKSLQKNFVLFKPLPPQIFKIRGSKSWNKANLWLGAEASIIAEDIVTNLKAMVENQSSLMLRDKNETKDRIFVLGFVMWGLFLLGLLVAGTASFLITKAIVGPIKELTEITDNLSMGEGLENTINLPPSSTELNTLSASLERLRRSLERMMGDM